MKKMFVLFLALIAGNLLAQGQSYSGATEEFFGDFWNSYCNNSVFQKSRVKFPLPCISYYDEGETETVYISAKDWKYDRVYEYSYELPQIRIESKNESYLVTRAGIESGYSVVYIFNLYDKKWYLIGIVINDL